MPSEIANVDYQRRLRSPNWMLVEGNLGCVPDRLRQLFQSDEVLKSDLVWGDNEFFVVEFSPLDEKEQCIPWTGIERGYLSFAGDGSGNQFLLRANTGPDWPVFFYDHETGDIEDVALSLEAFLAGLRRCDEDQ